jgi:hypothetical protein
MDRSVASGNFVDASKLTLAEYLRSWIAELTAADVAAEQAGNCLVGSNPTAVTRPGHGGK